MALFEIDWNPPRKSLRNFGLVGLVAFGALALKIYLGKPVHSATASAVAWVLALLALYCGVSALLAPRLLRALYIALSVVTFPIGLVVSHVIMAVVFFGIITPIGLIFRLIGRDAMNRRFDPSVSTYWVRRCAPQDVKRYFRQF